MTLERAIAELKLKDEQIDEMARQNEALDRRVEELQQQIALLQRRLYGPRSEKYHPDQLFLDEVLNQSESDSPAEEAPTVPVKASVRRKARPHGRLKIPDHIERVEEVLDLPDEQKVDPETGETLVKLREETSEKLAWKPGQWYVRRFIRPVYVHPDRQSENAGVYVQPMPDSPIEKCKADTSVLAMVAVKKYVDHLPLYRQRDIFRREGIEVASSTLNAWAIDPILACEPLYQAFRDEVLARPVIFTDDSPVKMLQEGLGRTKEARMWVYVGGCGPPYRFFDFTEDRRKERPAQILSKYAGFVHADAYSGYDHLFADSDRIIEVGCWAHARRKWDEALSSARKPCTEMLLRIRALYKVEAIIRGEKPQRRLEVRQAESVPLLDKLYERMAEIAAERVVLPSSLLAKAMGYAINQREALYRYTTDGRLEIDNNTAENAIRPHAVGRKNYLFVGSPRGGKACAMAMTFLQSAKAVGANPYEYLHDIYDRIMAHPANPPRTAARCLAARPTDPVAYISSAAAIPDAALPGSQGAYSAAGSCTCPTCGTFATRTTATSRTVAMPANWPATGAGTGRIRRLTTVIRRRTSAGCGNGAKRIRNTGTVRAEESPMRYKRRRRRKRLNVKRLQPA